MLTKTQSKRASDPSHLGSIRLNLTDFKEPKTNFMRTLLLSCFAMLFLNSASANETVVAGFHCPNNVYANCNDEIWDLSIYGNAYYVDYNGHQHWAGAPTVDYQLNSCNIGKIIRTWNYEDPYWNWHTCSQVIHVSGVSGGLTNLTWPHDIELEGCHENVDPYSLPHGYSVPSYYGGGECSQIGVNYDDDIFYFGGDCKKIRRTWTIIDWCVYDPNGWGNQGIWSYVQLIKISNTKAPNLYCPAGVKVSSFDCDSATVLLPPVNVDYSVCGGQFQVINNSPYAFANGADASGVYPIGHHNVNFTIKYSCGANTSCHVQIIVEDGKNPVPYCYAELVVALMPVDSDNDGVVDDGMVTIWASDLDKDSYDPCHNYSNLHFSFSPDITDNFKTFTCAEVGENEVRMYVTNNYGGQSYCVVTVDVQNNLANIPNCEPTPEGSNPGNYNGIVNGRVLMNDETPLVNAKISLEAAHPEMIIDEEITGTSYTPVVVDSYVTPLGNTVFLMENDEVHTYSYDTTYVDFKQDVMTGVDGYYIHQNVLSSMMYLMPEKSTCDMSKVNVNDAKVLHSFITGAATFDNPYLFLAADVDDNMVVNFDDLLHMIKYLTGEADGLPCVEPYWFVSRETEATDPFDLPIIDPAQVMVNANQTSNFNIIAVMKGDLDILVGADQLQDILDNSTLEIEASTSVESLNEFVQIKVQPNPATDIATIIISGENLGLNHQVTIFSITGERVIQKKAIRNGGNLNVELDVSALDAGYYFYDIRDGEKSYKGSFIKN